MRPAKPLLLVALLALIVAHNDLWLWNDPSLFLGLPVGLTYHVFYSVAASLLMFLLVRFAWPKHLEEANEDSPR